VVGVLVICAQAQILVDALHCTFVGGNLRICNCVHIHDLTILDTTSDGGEERRMGGRHEVRQGARECSHSLSLSVSLQQIGGGQISQTFLLKKHCNHFGK